MKYLLHTIMIIFILAMLSACQTFEEMRPEICPNCTDTEWQQKVEENRRMVAEFDRRSREDSRRINATLNRVDAEKVFEKKYPRCYYKFGREMRQMGVGSQQFLGLCEEYVKDSTQVATLDDPNKNTSNSDISNPVIRTNAPVKRWDNKGNPKTWLLVQSPLWPCLDRHKWKYENGVLKCISDKNTRGKTIKVTSTLTPYIPLQNQKNHSVKNSRVCFIPET